MRSIDAPIRPGHFAVVPGLSSNGNKTPIGCTDPPDADEAMVAGFAVGEFSVDELPDFPAEAEHLQALIGNKALYVVDERLGLWRHRSSRGKALAEVATQVAHDATDALQLQHVDVEVQPIEALTLQHDRLAQDFADPLWSLQQRRRSARIPNL